MKPKTEFHRPQIIALLFVLLVLPFIPFSFATPGFSLTAFDGTDGGTAFISPFGVAVDSNDNIIVADVGIRLVQVFDSDGNFIFDFDGTLGGGTEFSLPVGVAVDSNDNIIVVDTAFHTVQIFDSDGTFITAFDGTDGGTAFNNPTGVAVDSNDNIIVTNGREHMVQIFDSDGTFITAFDGTSGGHEQFNYPLGVAVDSNDRIIIADSNLELVQIFDSDGTFITAFDGTDGGTEFNAPFGVAVDSNDNIIVVDSDLLIVQMFSPLGNYINAFDGTLGGTEPFSSPLGVAADSNDRIIIADAGLDVVRIFEGVSDESETDASDSDESNSDASESSNSPSDDNDDNNGGCADCTAPTLGLNTFYKRVVDDGFSYNGNSVQVNKWHTPFPLITTQVGQLNTVEIIVYENGGIHNMELVQFGLGATAIGQPLSELEVLIEVWLETFNDKISIEKIIIKDRDNLIETFSVFAIAEIVKCKAVSQDEDCLKVTLQYSYREATINNIMVVNARDKPGNAQNFFFNEGVEVFGMSMNPVPYVTIFNKKTSQQTENIMLTLFRTDKVNNIWIDGMGIEYLHVSENRFDRITPQAPIECNDPPLSEINVPTRNNCHFRALTTIWD